MSDRRELLNDDQEALRCALEAAIASLWTALPAKIVSVDYTKRTCSCQPTIKGKIQKPDGTFEFVDMPLLVDVPIVVPSAGGFTLSLPIKADDEVLVVFGSRCIDSWWETGDVGVPMELRMHDLSDGFAIAGPRSVPKATPLHATNARLTNDEGTAYVELTTAGIVKLKSTSSIQLEAPDILIQGNLAVSGATQLGGKSFENHKHSGVATGSGQTGVPV